MAITTIARGQISITDSFDGDSCYLTNDAVVCPCNADGSGTILVGANTTVLVMHQGVQVTPIIGTLIVSGCTATASTNKITINTVTADSGYVDIPVTYSGTSYGLQRFSFSKSKQGATGGTGAPGAPGANAIMGVLNNDSQSIPSDSAGNNQIVTGGVSTLTIYEGVTDMTTSWNLGTPVVSGAVGTFSGSPTNRTFTLSANGMSSDSATVTWTATKSGYSNIVKIFSLTRVKAGAAGSTGLNATAYWLSDNVSAIQMNISKVYTPTTITATGFSQVGVASPSSSAIFKFGISESTDGVTFGADKYSSVSAEASKVYTPTAQGTSAIKAVRVRLFQSITTLPSSIGYIDEQIIPIVSDGSTGATGGVGANGKSYVLNLVGGVRTVTYDASGVNPTPAQSAFTTNLYENGVLIAPGNYTYSWSATGSLSGVSTTSSFTPVIATTYATGSNMVSLTATYAGQTVMVSCSIVIVKALPTFITATKMTATTIESPTITGGTLAGGTITAGGSTNGILYVKDASDVNQVIINTNGLIAHKITFANDVDHPLTGPIDVGMYGIDFNIYNTNAGGSVTLGTSGTGQTASSITIGTSSTSISSDNISIAGMTIDTPVYIAGAITIDGDNTPIVILGEIHNTKTGGTFADPWSSHACAAKFSGDVAIGGMMQISSVYPQIIGDGAVLQFSFSTAGTGGLVIQANTDRPATDNADTLGTSAKRFKTIYITTAAVVGSDRNIKNTIVPLDNKQTMDFMMGLIPDSYKMNSGESNRTHYGLISQDVEDLMTKLGMTSLDFAGFIKSPKMKDILDKDGNDTFKQEVIPNEYDYAIRYEELIAPMINVIQQQQKTITALTERIVALETKKVA